MLKPNAVRSKKGEIKMPRIFYTSKREIKMQQKVSVLQYTPDLPCAAAPRIICHF